MHKSQTDQQVTERTVSELVKSEVERTLTSLSQTVIEFYPELMVCGSDTLTTPSLIPPKKHLNSPGGTVTAIVPSGPSIAKQPIKRIIRTDMGVKREKTTQTEAIQRKDSVSQRRTTSESQIAEKPPASALPETLLFIVCGILLLLYFLYYFFNRFH